MVSDGSSPKDVQVTLTLEGKEEGGEEQKGALENKLKKLVVGACLWAQGQWVANRNPEQKELHVVSSSLQVEENEQSGQDQQQQPTTTAEQPKESWNIIGDCESWSYPLQKKRHSVEFLRSPEVLHLRSRTRHFSSILRLRSFLSHSLHSSLQDQGYLHLHSPLLTTNDCEGAGEMFHVLSPTDLISIPFDDNLSSSSSSSSSSTSSASTSSSSTSSKKKKEKLRVEDEKKRFFKTGVHLSVSGQLHLEAIVMGITPGVYSFGPIFRADPSNTANHLAEFWMLEPELAFAGLSDAMGLCETLIRSSISEILNHAQRSEDLTYLLANHQTIYPASENTTGSSNSGDQFLGNATFSQQQHEETLQKCLQPFASMTYTEAVNVLGLPWGSDFERVHEKALCQNHCGGRPLFVTDYPAALKPFYMRLNDNCSEDRQTVACMDLLLPGLGEVAGGSAREERYDLLHSRCMEQPHLLKHLKWYLDLRKYGTSPHAGFGIGFDRLLQFITATPNIRDVIPFPRTKGRCDF